MRKADPGLDDATVAFLRSNLTPESVIESARHQFKKAGDDESFVSILSKELYGALKAHASAEEWAAITRAFTTWTPAKCPLEVWTGLIDSVERLPDRPSALGVAQVLARFAKDQVRPKAILSFNAEPLLLALTEAFLARDHQCQERIFLPTAESTALQTAHGIPYYFCHGRLPPLRDFSITKIRAISGVEKLVFSESEYLLLANSVFSWQAATFLSHCMRHTAVFLGLSFTDPNLRRWLAWAHKNRVSELAAKGINDDSTTHFWINRDPGTERVRSWVENSVAHLGVRLIWIKDWSVVAQTLTSMLE